jgi:hypothetical protein
MTESAEFLRAAIEYAERQFAVWRREEHLTERQFEQVQRDYAQWRGSIDPERDYSEQFTTAWDTSLYDQSTLPRLQLLAFLQQEVRRRHAAQQIEAGPTRYFLSQIEHQATLLKAAPRGDAPALQQPQPAPRARGVVELLLDPRSLNLMMMCGGALLTLGLVAWLWAVGVFENKVVVACLLGGANLAALAAGAALTLRTRHQTAGKAITMLASLVLLVVGNTTSCRALRSRPSNRIASRFTVTASDCCRSQDGAPTIAASGMITSAPLKQLATVSLSRTSPRTNSNPGLLQRWKRLCSPWRRLSNTVT